MGARAGTSAVPSPRSRGRLVAVLGAVGLYLAAFAVIGAGAAWRSRAMVTVGCAGLVGSALVLQVALLSARLGGRLALLRQLLPLGLAAGGLLLVGYAVLGAVDGLDSGAWGTCGACALYLAIGQGLVLLRARVGPRSLGGAVVTCVCVAAPRRGSPGAHRPRRAPPRPPRRPRPAAGAPHRLSLLVVGALRPFWRARSAAVQERMFGDGP